jgi:hypothetical protein
MDMVDGRRRVWVGVLAGVAAAVVLLFVALGAYRAGEENGEDTAVVETVQDQGELGDGNGDGGEVVRVVDDDDRDRDWGPGFLLFPLFVILLVVLAVRAGRGGWGHGHRWGHYGHPGWGRYPPNGPPWRSEGDPRAAWLDDWHRRQHGEHGEEEKPETPSEA